MCSMYFVQSVASLTTNLLIRTVNTMCKDCWLADNNKDKKWNVKILPIIIEDVKEQQVK
jgi:hypothetical protein